MLCLFDLVMKETMCCIIKKLYEEPYHAVKVDGQQSRVETTNPRFPIAVHITIKTPKAGFKNFV